MTYRTTAVVAILGAFGASTALAEKILQIDTNDMAFQSLNDAGDAAPFDGESHTGAVSITKIDASEANAVLIKDSPFGPFVPQGDFVGILGDITFDITLDSGLVTGGSFSIELTSGDTYAGTIGASGHVDATQTGFTIDGLTLAGAFSGDDFGGVDVTEWFDAQGIGTNLEGSFLAFKINPDDTGAAIADIDSFVIVPAPAAGVVLLAGLVGMRRRR